MAFWKTEARFTGPNEWCAHPEWWTAHDDQATENEVIEGISGLIRLMQPQIVVETGTHLGLMAFAIGQALLANGHGHLYTYELRQEFFAKAKKRCEGLPVTCFHQSSAAANLDSIDGGPGVEIDFMWVDGAPDRRRRDFLHFKQWMRARTETRAGTIVGFHDVAPHHRDIRAQVDRAEESGWIRSIQFGTPRGVVLSEVIV